MNKTKIIIMLSIFILVILQTIPTLALRTSVFINGYPVAAFTTQIEECEPYALDERTDLQNNNVKLYRLMPPPVEKATDGQLYTWQVKKIGLLHFASYYGET